jgi:hypothetical protein
MPVIPALHWQILTLAIFRSSTTPARVRERMIEANASVIGEP